MRSIGLYSAYLFAAALLLLAGCETTPIQQDSPVYYPSQPAYGYEDIRRCRADNQRSHADVVDAYERARQSGRINPAEAQQFNAMEARLRNMRADLGRDGLTMQECQRIGGAIARERNEVARMSRFDPPPTQCMADNRRAHQEVVAMYENARRSGRINPAEAQRFNAIEARLNNLRNELGRDGISLQDCQRIGGAIAREREEVQRMARYDPATARCVADNRRAHDDVYRVYNDGVRSGRINPNEAKRFQAIEERLRNLQADLKRDGLSLAECQRIGRAVAQERAIVDGMLR
jgi:hypothetical protein